MQTIYKERKFGLRVQAILLSTLLSVLLLTGCGGDSRNASVPPPVDDTAGRNMSDRSLVNQP